MSELPGTGKTVMTPKLSTKTNPKQMRHRFRVFILLNLFTILFIVNSSHAASMRPVRVLLGESVRSAEISTSSSLTIADAQNGKRLKTGQVSKVRIARNSRGLQIDGQVFPLERVKISAGGAPISFNGKLYSGEFEIGKGAVRELDVINHIAIEEYLKGVLPLEMPPKWPLEALIAQSIAARTYTLYKMEETARKSWDVVATTEDQVYGGKAREVETTNRAVTISKGITLTYEGKPARAYYHSTSGTRTENSKVVFSEESIPYLKGVSCIFDIESPHRFWKEDIPFAEIEERLRKNGIATGKLIKLTPKSFTSSGRINELNLHTTSDKTVIKATLFRKLMGTTRIKSTWFRMRNRLDSVTLSGRGFGHGVGLCQWGARGMAERGMGYKKILMHYYPGTTLSPSEITVGYSKGI